MPQDDLKLELVRRSQSADPQLNAERSLMRLSGAWPEAMNVEAKEMRLLRPFADVAGTLAMVHPALPKTIFYHPDYVGVEDQVDSTFAHELQHVRQLSGRPLIERLFTNTLRNMTTPYTQRAPEHEAEKAAQGYMSRKKGDISLDPLGKFNQQKRLK